MTTGPRTVRIGITGPIGCGKSQVVRWLAELGVPSWTRTGLASVTSPGHPAHDLVLRRFGAAVPARTGRWIARRSAGSCSRTPPRSGTSSRSSIPPSGPASWPRSRPRRRPGRPRWRSRRSSWSRAGWRPRATRSGWSPATPRPARAARRAGHAGGGRRAADRRPGRARGSPAAGRDMGPGRERTGGRDPGPRGRGPRGGAADAALRWSRTAPGGAGAAGGASSRPWGQSESFRTYDPR